MTPNLEISELRFRQFGWLTEIIQPVSSRNRIQPRFQNHPVEGYALHTTLTQQLSTKKMQEIKTGKSCALEGGSRTCISNKFPRGCRFCWSGSHFGKIQKEWLEGWLWDREKREKKTGMGYSEQLLCGTLSTTLCEAMTITLRTGEALGDQVSIFWILVPWIPC